MNDDYCSIRTACLITRTPTLYILIVALIVTHTDWVCRVARVLYLFYSTLIVLLSTI